MFFSSLIKKLSSQAFQSALFKGLTGFFMFLSISILVRFLGKDSYGIWVLVFSFFQWGLYFDFGISNVLKSKIPELVTKKSSEINAYISESTTLTIFIAIVLFGGFSFVSLFFNLNSALNIPLDKQSTQILFLMNGLFFCVNFILSLSKSLYIGILNPKIAEFSATISQFLFLLLSILAYLFLDENSSYQKLLAITLLNGISTLIVNGFFFWFFFKQTKYKIQLFQNRSKAIAKEILKDGSQFMIIQCFMVIIFFSDPYFIAALSSPEDVSTFDIINKLFQLPLLVITSGLASFWPFFSQKFHEKDFEWFKTVFKKFQLFFILAGLGLLLFVFISKILLNYWVGAAISNAIAFELLLLMGLAVLFRVYFTFYANFFNGINKLKSQMVVMGLTAVLKIPLTLFLLKNGYGLNGIFLQLTIFMLLWAIYFKIESTILLNKHK